MVSVTKTTGKTQVQNLQIPALGVYKLEFTLPLQMAL
jgi:hypothetical protein